MLGSVLEGKYRLVHELGAGGMGVVYLAEHETIERKVAIKVLHQQLASDRSVRRRFETEAKAIARLKHPNCVMLYEFGYSNEIEALFAVFEYVEGKSLESWVGQALPVGDVVQLGIQVASGIGHSHDNNIIHRDLKPENIMIAPNGGKAGFELKLLDFGIARIAEDDEKRTRLTQMGQMFGTPPYMSPEQIRAKLNVTHATDIYSIGVIMYEMLEGELPFLGDTPIETVMMHLNEEVPPFSRKGIPKELCDIVMRCLEKDAQDRFESCEELAEALRGLEIGDEATSLLAAPYTAKISAPSAKDELSEDGEESDTGRDADEDIASGPTLLAGSTAEDLAEAEKEKEPPNESHTESQDSQISQEASTPPPKEVTTQDVMNDEEFEGAFPAGRPTLIVGAIVALVLVVGGVLAIVVLTSTDPETSADADEEVAVASDTSSEDERRANSNRDDEVPEEELAAVEDDPDGDDDVDTDDDAGDEEVAGDDDADEEGDEERASDDRGTATEQPATEASPSTSGSTQPEPTPPPQQDPPPRQPEEEPSSPSAPDAITLPGPDDNDNDDDGPTQVPEGIGLPAPN